MRQARNGFGDDGDLMIDAGLVCDAKTAIQRAQAFAEYNIFWLEEPLQPDDYVGYAKLSRRQPRADRRGRVGEQAAVVPRPHGPAASTSCRST